MSQANNNAKQNILIIDDEPGIRELLSRELKELGYQVEMAQDGKRAVEQIIGGEYQLALCDINMPDMDGLEVLDAVQKSHADIEVIMMTGYGTVETAVAAMKRGAYDFIQKPFNLDEVLQLVEKSLEKRDLKSTIQELREAKKKLEETQAQLIQAEKLAGLGQLAAGVAHELNNPLSGVMGFTQLMLDDKTLSSQQRKDLETIYGQSQRCRTIIQNLLQFSRRKDPKKEPSDLGPLIQATIDLVKYDFSTSGVNIVLKIPDSLPMVFGDSQQLQQVFLNLLTNARQAMAARSKSQLTLEAGRQKETVFVRFTDNGPGIPENIRGKIFDPFFTTKPVGQGTGLGLSICHGIIEQHHGRIEVESVLKQGTTFTVTLPIHEQRHVD